MFSSFPQIVASIKSRSEDEIMQFTKNWLASQSQSGQFPRLSFPCESVLSLEPPRVYEMIETSFPKKRKYSEAPRYCLDLLPIPALRRIAQNLNEKESIVFSLVSKRCQQILLEHNASFGKWDLMSEVRKRLRVIANRSRPDYMEFIPVFEKSFPTLAAQAAATKTLKDLAGDQIWNEIFGTRDERLKQALPNMIVNKMQLEDFGEDDEGNFEVKRFYVSLQLTTHLPHHIDVQIWRYQSIPTSYVTYYGLMDREDIRFPHHLPSFTPNFYSQEITKGFERVGLPSEHPLLTALALFYVSISLFFLPANCLSAIAHEIHETILEKISALYDDDQNLQKYAKREMKLWGFELQRNKSLFSDLERLGF